MKKLTLLFLFTLFCSLFTFHAFSQSCLPEGITFTTQEQIDSFQINYPGCMDIEGDVEIFGNDINNLNGLNILTSIEGSITFQGTSLTNLEGLESMTLIGGNLLFGDIFFGTHNPLLTSLTGLNNVTYIGGNVEISSTLTSCTGLNNLSSIGGNLGVGFSTITNLTGLEDLTSINGSLYIDYNELTSLTGLNNLKTIGGNLEIIHNNSLTNITAFENLISIGGYLKIGGYTNFGWGPHGNASLSSLTGLDNVTSIGGELWIYDNDTLTDLSGLSNIAANSISRLIIKHNSLLTACSIESICDYLASPNALVDIFNNALDCNSAEEVKEACALSVGEVTVFDNFSIHPNPFSNTLTIEYLLKQTKSMTLVIYNHLGEQVGKIGKKRSQGAHQEEWNAAGLPAGIYYCVLSTEAGMQTVKLIKL